MASIRIVDDWLRSPASAPSHYRSVMVITEKWAEQRVLMRAYADSRDQLRPTIVLHGVELAIGPAGLDVNGPWGIHVSDPDNGRAQFVKEQLEAAARRLAGSKGNPPRLADEESTFEREPTANWGPGAPRILPKRPDARSGGPDVSYVAPVGAARVPQSQAATYIPQQQAAVGGTAQSSAKMPAQGDLRKTPHPYAARARSRTRQPVTVEKSTNLGYTSGSGAQSAVVRLGLSPAVSSRLGRLVDRMVPPDFQISTAERKVLNALGEQELSAPAIGNMLDLSDPMTFMENLTRKLEAQGLDLVEPGDLRGGEPTYRLRR